MYTFLLNDAIQKFEYKCIRCVRLIFNRLCLGNFFISMTHNNSSIVSIKHPTLYSDNIVPLLL